MAAVSSIITTKCRPITPPGGQVTFAVSAEPTVPSKRPHSVKLDVVGFDVTFGWDAIFLTPTTTLCRFSSEMNRSIIDCGMCYGYSYQNL